MAEGLSKQALDEIVKLARTSQGIIATVGNSQFAVIPNDLKVVHLNDEIDLRRTLGPRRKAGTVKVFDTESFCEYFTLFSDPNSRVFADETNNRILAVLDYHGAGDNAPRWGEHRVDFNMRHSEEWNRWKAWDGQRKAQMDFAEFIEDNAPDIVNPSAATMLEVSRDLRAKIDADFGSTIQMSNGSVRFRFSETVKGTFGSGDIDVPEQFTISIPIYLGCERVPLTARLRYRISSGKLTLWFNLLRAEAIEREAFYAARGAIEQKLSITVIDGIPA